MEILRAADRIATLWKNGGGETREVALFPEGAGWADFQWRISIATVTASGPFSAFPGIDRTLVVLDGALQLTIDGGIQPVQRASSPPIRFDGAAATHGTLIEGAVTDLNLMVRRGSCIGSLMPLHSRDAADNESRRFIIAAAPCMLGDVRLAAQDALSLMPGETMPLLPADARGWIVRLEETAA